MTTYEIGYEDGTYRRQQLPTTNKIEKTVLLLDDMEGAKDWLYLVDCSEYTKGWVDGYQNNQPINRE